MTSRTSRLTRNRPSNRRFIQTRPRRGRRRRTQRRRQRNLSSHLPNTNNRTRSPRPLQLNNMIITRNLLTTSTTRGTRPNRSINHRQNRLAILNTLDNLNPIRQAGRQHHHNRRRQHRRRRRRPREPKHTRRRNHSRNRHTRHTSHPNSRLRHNARSI